MSETKKNVRVVGISSGFSMPRFATRVEDAVNNLQNEGYAVEVVRQPLGVLIIGQHVGVEDDQAETGAVSIQGIDLSSDDPIAQVIRQRLGGLGTSNESALSDKSKVLMNKFLQHISTSDTAAFLAEARTHLAEFTRGHSVEDMLSASAEMVQDVARHKVHCQSTSCPFNDIYVGLSRLLAETASLNLQ